MPCYNAMYNEKQFKKRKQQQKDNNNNKEQYTSAEWYKNKNKLADLQVMAHEYCTVINSDNINSDNNSSIARKKSIVLRSHEELDPNAESDSDLGNNRVYWQNKDLQPE